MRECRNPVIYIQFKYKCQCTCIIYLVIDSESRFSYTSGTISKPSTSFLALKVWILIPNPLFPDNCMQWRWWWPTFETTPNEGSFLQSFFWLHKVRELYHNEYFVRTAVRCKAVQLSLASIHFSEVFFLQMEAAVKRTARAREDLHGSWFINLDNEQKKFFFWSRAWNGKIHPVTEPWMATCNKRKSLASVWCHWRGELLHAGEDRMYNHTSTDKPSNYMTSPFDLSSSTSLRCACA